MIVGEGGTEFADPALFSSDREEVESCDRGDIKDDAGMLLEEELFFCAASLSSWFSLSSKELRNSSASFVSRCQLCG